MFGNRDRTLGVATQAVELLLANEKLTAENAKLRAQLAEAKNLLRNLPGMMGGDDWVDFLDPNDERYVLIIISRLAGTQEVKR